MDLVGQMYKLSACFDTPKEYKGLPYDYFPEEAVTYGSTSCSFGLPYNDHNYGMPIGLTPPVMAPHLMDPIPKPKKTLNSINPQWTKIETKTEPGVGDSSFIKSESEVGNSCTDANGNSITPRKQYLDENDYPIYVEPEIKVVEVPNDLCVSASEYSDCTTESSDDDDGSYNPDFINYLKSLPKKHLSVEKYLEKAKRKFDYSATSQKSSESEKKESQTPDCIIDCICEYCYDDKRMVQCESCGVRQHIDCMYTNPRQVQNFLKHRCHKCSDISVDVGRAKAIQQSRKNWHLTANKFACKSKFSKYDEHKRPREFTVNFREIKTDRKHSDGSRSRSNPTTYSSIGRVNKRKQDLKACLTGEQSSPPEEGASTTNNNIDKSPHYGGEASSITSATSSRGELPDQSLDNENGATDARMAPLDPPARDQQPEPPCLVAMTSSNTNATAEEFDKPSSQHNPTINQSGLINHRRSVPMKKDYKEAHKSLYSNKLLSKVTQYGDTDRLSASPVDGAIDQGAEFLDRNPRCRIVIFDSCTMGIEASVRLQPGSIVAALFGKMMLMDEYLACTNPTQEYRPYVFLYHTFFSEKGLAIDCSNYGNITRYLRRSCDPNVKLEHMIIGGTLYVVIRTTSEVFQGVELTMPFDVPFELCQYAVQCACGKVRCPAVKHRRKHHRSRVIPANINCEQVIEDKLRELSQPLAGSPGTGASTAGTTGTNSGTNSANQTPVSVVKKLGQQTTNRFGLHNRNSAFSNNYLDSQRLLTKNLANITDSPPHSNINISHSRYKSPSNQYAQPIKQEELEPRSINETASPSSCSDDDSVKTTPSKQPTSTTPTTSHSILLNSPSNNLLSSHPIIVSGKRKPKPIQHPDFEMDFDSYSILNRQPISTTHIKDNITNIKPKREPVIKSQAETPNKTSVDNNSDNQFKSIITTRRQKFNSPLNNSNPNTNETPKKLTTRRATKK